MGKSEEEMDSEDVCSDMQSVSLEVSKDEFESSDVKVTRMSSSSDE
jgi:hypothetical protein